MCKKVQNKLFFAPWNDLQVLQLLNTVMDSVNLSLMNIGLYYNCLFNVKFKSLVG